MAKIRRRKKYINRVSNLKWNNLFGSTLDWATFYLIVLRQTWGVYGGGKKPQKIINSGLKWVNNVFNVDTKNTFLLFWPFLKVSTAKSRFHKSWRRRRVFHHLMREYFSEERFSHIEIAHWRMRGWIRRIMETGLDGERMTVEIQEDTYVC